VRPKASTTPSLPAAPAASLPAADAASILSQPYGALALHYDTVMAHVDYPGWARHLRGLWRAARGRKVKPRRVLELAAGTCRFAEHPLFPDAFTVQTDLSPAMLRTAAVSLPNLSSASHKLRLAACDARVLPFPNAGFDLVVMVYDSLNYMTRPEDVRRVLDEALRVLAPGGVFLFDVTTATCSRRHFADALDFQETEAGALVRASRYDAASRTQLNLFTFFTVGPDGRYDRAEEVHRQRIWPAAMLKKTAREAGFSVRACLADFTLKPGTDRHERLHFILQRPLKDS
jgi:ubiquinone/menaquinone biosynthesis C-methylase UbiE